MINSRDIDDLRPDVAANCRMLLEQCKQRGLNVLITQTLRDNEYQATLYAQGRTKPGSIVTNAKTTSFHGAGLAFDFCKNVKGHEYDDASFFLNVAIIAKAIGFSWGGDWKSFPDKPHLQWDEHGKYTNAMIRAGKRPAEMEEYVTYDMWKKYMEQYRAELAKKPASQWKNGELDGAKNMGITDGTRPGDLVTREECAVMCARVAKR